MLSWQAAVIENDPGIEMEETLLDNKNDKVL